MKKNILVILFLLLIISISYSQAPWNNILSFGQNFRSLWVFDSSKVLVAGDEICFKTFNGGLNWYEIILNTTVNVTSVYFTDSANGYMCGVNGKFLKSSNGGLNWSKTDICAGCYLNSIFFTNYNIGYIAGESGLLKKTINAGSNWFDLTTGTSSGLRSLYFTSENTGYAAGGDSYNGIIIKTTNSGNNWSTICTTSGVYFNAITFPTAAVGFAVGSNNGVYKTTNSGLNWLSKNYLSGGVLFSTYFLNPDTGFAAGGMIYRTSNGGTNWIIQQSPSTYYVSCIRFANANTGYLSTEFQNIFKTTNGGNPIGIQTISTELPSAFSLSQNYPNPFNPSTSIKFDIPPSKGERGMTPVKLIVYDVTGRIVTILFNQQMQPGSYSVDWDGTNYPSGVYFYQLSIGNEQIATKKMVLIK